MPMGSGPKAEVINPRERAISSDVNRLQAFLAASVADALSYLLDAQGTDSFNVSQGQSGGGAAPATTTGTPMRGVVMSGLLVTPAVGSNATTVAPGVLLACNPDPAPNPDDSVYKLIADPGTIALTMPTNSSGGAQVYVVECSRLDTVLETDNRDQFNNSTGLFSPVNVNKVVASRLAYRVRAVAIASGVTFAAGWLPLMVAVAPNGATTWNDCVHMWDVRPLANDHFRGPNLLASKYAHVYESNFRIDFGTPLLRGRALAQSPGGRLLGGELALDALGTSIDTTSTSVQATGFVFTSNRPYYLYLAEPYGLPRWCRYTSVASGSRSPGPLRGMPVLVDSAAAADPFAGTNANSAAFNMPSAFGFAQQVAQGTAVCVWAGMVGAANTQVQDGADDGLRFSQQAAQTTAASASSTTDATFLLTCAVNVPRNARAAYVRLFASYAGNVTVAGVVAQLIGFTDNAGNNLGSLWIDRKYFGTGVAYNVDVVVRVPIANSLPQNSTPQVTLTLTHAAATLGYAVAPTTTGMEVLGWELR